MGIKQFNHAALIDFTNCIAPDEQACILHGSRCHQCMTVCLNPKIRILSSNERMIYLSSTWVDAGLSASSTFFNTKFWNALRHGSRHASHFFNVFNELYKKKKHRSEQNDSMMRDYNTTAFIFVDDVYLTKTAPDTKVVKRFAFTAVLAVCHDWIVAEK